MADAGQSRTLKLKVCILGAAGVGKTSLVRRFVNSLFDDKYLSTVGVKIEKKSVQLENAEVVLNIWDVAGEEEFFQIPKSYYSGAAGYLLVIDGTRPATLTTALEIKRRVSENTADAAWLILLNKADLVDAWKLDAATLARLNAESISTFETSARDGRNVEQSFTALAQALAG